MRSLSAEFFRSPAPVETFLGHMEEMLAEARQQKCLRLLADGRRGPVFRPLLLGYNGAGNTGADVRVIEMLRQLRRLFGHIRFEPALWASGTDFRHPAFRTVTQVHADSYFPDFLTQGSHAYTGIVACEGSMFTSTFSDSLTGMFAGAIGFATALGHLGIGYGAEADAMNAPLERFIPGACAGSLVFARNRRSLERLRGLGVRAHAGADPAWTYEPEVRRDADLLRQAGWDGVSPVAALCPINPCCWPLVIDMERARSVATSGRRDEHQYEGILFHSWSDEAASAYDAYLAGFAELVSWLRGNGWFPVLIGMQGMDRSCCERFNGKLKAPLPMFARGEYGIDDIVSLLHGASLIVSSRYHATVIGMSAGVPCIGVSMDGRINSLFAENGLQEWLLPCHAEGLGPLLVRCASRAVLQKDALVAQYGALTARQIRAVGRMGMDFMNEARAVYRDLPPCPLPFGWDAYLPPLAARVERLLSRYDRNPATAFEV